jgi:hypothetical protein
MTYRAEEHLALLKPFQRATVDYIFRRLFSDAAPTNQFLVADEVGLGKTMVARGVIAKTIEHLSGSKPQINIVYICSSQAIAEQNIKSLNVIGSSAKPLNTRLTLLPLEIDQKDGFAANPINLVSLTPGTAFDLKSTLGKASERALIYEMLRRRIGLRHRGVARIFRGGVEERNWPNEIERIQRQSISSDIAARYNAAVDETILQRIRMAAEIARAYKKPNYPDELRPAAIIGDLRRILAQTCVSSLRPDLIILDEFQRFAELLHDHDPDTAPEKAAAAELARALFAYQKEDGSKAKLLLLSATPYRMLTLNSDAPEEGEHYDDFLRTMRFLFGDDEGDRRVGELKAELGHFRRSLQSLPDAYEAAKEQRNWLHKALGAVIARTERVDSTQDRNALVTEVIPHLIIETDDLREARAMAKIAELIGAPSTIEYWKSSPYLLNFMKDYKQRDKLQSLVERPSPELRKAIREAGPWMINKDQVDSYTEIPYRNARMRALADLTFAEGLDRAIWIPPSRPSFGEAKSATKTLVFSDWSMVPDAIAALLSHEASRRMNMMPELVSRTLRPIGIEEMMPMLHPSPVLAEWVDPLSLERRFGPADSFDALHAQACTVLRERLNDSLLSELAQGTDRLLPLSLDKALQREVNWLRIGAEDYDAHEENGAMGRAITILSEALDKDGHPGALEPEIVVEKLASIALGSPAICALRALARICPGQPLDDPAMVGAALTIALGFRSLYNQPETRALLGEKSPLNYWWDVICHAGTHDLPAVLDEYLQLLLESERAESLPPPERARLIAEKLISVVALRPAQITLDHWSAGRVRLHERTFEVRARFAMRFAAKSEEEKGLRRTALVQAAFKSPFRPFVLATTSIGQEGLDFHSYCSRVVHWNLPRNPVDIEQREGRVHRFKNHAVRRNIAAAFSQTALNANCQPSPWRAMFDAAQAEELAKGGAGDIIPYWVYPGRHTIERVVLIPPFSREKERYQDLMTSLATYRLAFGQPRQDELLKLFASLDEEAVRKLTSLQITLRPPTPSILD